MSYPFGTANCTQGRTTMLQAHRLFLGVSAALLAGSVVTNPAFAIGIAKAKAAINQEKKVLFSKEVAELRATKALLERADHDYKGHRAAAVKEITVAIHALEPSHPSAEAKAAKGVLKETGNPALAKEAAREVHQAKKAKQAAK